MSRENKRMLMKLVGLALSFAYESIVAWFYVVLVLVTLAYGRSFPNAFVRDESLSLNIIVAGMFLTLWIGRIAFRSELFLFTDKEKKS